MADSGIVKTVSPGTIRLLDRDLMNQEHDLGRSRASSPGSSSIASVPRQDRAPPAQTSAAPPTPEASSDDQAARSDHSSSIGSVISGFGLSVRNDVACEVALLEVSLLKLNMRTWS